MLSVREVSGKRVRIKKLNNLFSRVSMHERIEFARNLGSMLEAGLTVTRSLAVFEKQTRNASFKAILSSIRDKIEKGARLSDALKEYPKVFSALFTSMTHAGEESGSLSESLRSVAVQMEQVYQLRKKIRGAMTYPIIVFSVMILVGVVMLTYVVPALSGTFKELHIELPTSTKIIVGISDFMSNNFILTILIIIGTVSAFVSGLRTRLGKRAFEYVLLHTPIIATLVRETNSARTARTLSSLLTAGVEVIDALQITQDVVQNSYFKKVLQDAKKEIQTGAPIAQVFERAEHLYPPFVAEMVAVGEETGSLSTMLVHVADFYENEVGRKTKDMSTIIEPFLMVIIGAAVGFFAVSMIQPIYSISSGI